MNDICVNSQTTQGNVSSVEAQCLASWFLTGDQILVALYAWAGVIVIACVWIGFSSMQKRHLEKGEIGFSLLLRTWAGTSRFAAIMNRPVKMIVSLLILIAFAVRCATYEVTALGFHLLTVLYLISFIDEIIRFLGARFKLLHVLSPYVVLEILCIVSHFVLGYGDSRVEVGDDIESRTWLDFSPLQSIFVYRSFVEMEKNFVRSSKGWMVFRLIFKSSMLVIFAAGTIFVLETLGELPYFENNGFAHLYKCPNGTITSNTDAGCDETWSVMFSFYFTIVTLTTVGYGDNSPQNVLSRLLVIVFIVGGIILFSMEIETWIAIYRLLGVGNAPYKPKENTMHVVVMGNPSFVQLTGILREVLHDDHTRQEGDTRRLHTVIFGDKSCRYAKMLIKRLEEHPDYGRHVTYVAGDPSNTDDFERVRLKEAEAAFFFPDKSASDPNEEDYKNIMQVLATKRYVGPQFRCLVMLLRTENMRHVIAAGVHRDDIIAEDCVKMGILAQSCRCPGYSTMIANLSSCLSFDNSKVLEEGAIGFLRGKSKAKLTEQGVADECLGDQVSEMSFRKEYFEGASREIYVLELAMMFIGMTFADAVARAFYKSHGKVVLIGCEVGLQSIESNGITSPEASGTRVLLNPGTSLRITPEMKIYALADDFDAICSFGITSMSDASPTSSTNAPGLLHSASLEEGLFNPDLVEHDQQNESDGIPLATSNYDALTTPALSLTPQESSPRDVSIHLDNSLARVAFTYRGEGADIPVNDRLITYDISNHYGDEKAVPLSPPSIEILRDPNHIVICSYLGENSVQALEFFISPLRGVYSTIQPPITILDEAEFSDECNRMLMKFGNVYHVRGSPLVYHELQRAGAKGAAAVVIFASKSEFGSSVIADVESSLRDANAIFTTMLLELKMDDTQIFTLTELSDQSNSEFLQDPSKEDTPPEGNTQLQQMEYERSVWNTALRTIPLVDRQSTSIFGLPRYMTGRLYHPQFCENLLVQSFYNPNVHRLIRQLFGGPRSTGCILMYELPTSLRNVPDSTFGDAFSAFLQSKCGGIAMGIYRVPAMGTTSADASTCSKLPIVITAPSEQFQLRQDDRFYVLIGWHVLEDSARNIQRIFRGFNCRVAIFGRICAWYARRAKADRP